jgi:hypothetical protein
MNHGRILAALAGVAFLGGSLTIILGQALLTPSAWGQYQVLTVLMILGTIAAGHLAKTAFKACFVASALGFCVLFVAGSALVVYNSVGRQAEAHDTIAMERAAANGLIEDKTRDIEAARERLAAAERNADRERGSKCKTKCKDWENAAADARNVIRVLESEIRALGAPKPVDAKADKAGELAAVFGYDRNKAAALAALVEPFLWTVFFEIGSIVSLGFAFRPFPVSTVSKPVSDSGNSGGGKAERLPIRLVEDHEVAALKKALQGGRALTNDELALAMRVAKGEASKRVSKAETLGLVRRERVGKHVSISLMHAH